MHDASLPGEPPEYQLSAWFSEYGDSVLRMCYVYLKDRQLAEDAMQDTFIKAWRSMDKRRGTSSVKTWIMRIAINTCKDYKRAAWFKHVDRAASAESYALSAQPVETDSRILFDDLMQLPDKLKQAVLLHHYQGMTLDETASALSISRSAVSGRLSKAYSMLRGFLEKEDNI